MIYKDGYILNNKFTYKQTSNVIKAYILIRYDCIIMRFASWAKKKLITHNAESRNKNKEEKRNLKRNNICLFLL